MLVMFGGFGAYFLYDWKIGYPQKNYVIANYTAFNKAGEAWTVDANRASPEVWNAFVEKQTINFDEDRSIYPSNTDFGEKWPEILKQMEKKYRSDDLWADYSGEKGWPQKVNLEDDPKTAGQIREQLVAACVCFLLTTIALFFLIRTKGRFMKVDDEGYYPPGGSLISFAAMKSLDMRKWETKGLATLIYEADGKFNKAKIDGMVYGQFKEEEGAPADALFQRILENFEGELIELVDENENEEIDDQVQEINDDGASSKGDSDDSGEKE
jgi:hypothetical protein